MWIQWKLQIWLSLVLRYQPSFHGVDLSALRGAAVDEYFRQPIVVRHPLPTNNFTPTIYSVEMCNWNEELVWGRVVNQGEVLPSECGAEKKTKMILSVVNFCCSFPYLMSPDLFLQDTFDIRILMAKSVKHTVNFLEAKEEDLYRFVNVL